MTPADKWLLWIAINEAGAGVFYLVQGQRGDALAWFAYALACVGFACRKFL
jgi:hypothetical protein